MYETAFFDFTSQTCFFLLQYSSYWYMTTLFIHLFNQKPWFCPIPQSKHHQILSSSTFRIYPECNCLSCLLNYFLMEILVIPHLDYINNFITDFPASALVLCLFSAHYLDSFKTKVICHCTRIPAVASPFYSEYTVDPPTMQGLVVLTPAQSKSIHNC